MKVQVNFGALTKPLLIAFAVLSAIVVTNYVTSIGDETKMSKYIQEVKTHKKRADSAVVAADSAKKLAAKLQADANAAKVKADSLNKQVDVAKSKVAAAKSEIAGLKGQLTSAQTLGDSVKTMVEIIVVQDSTIAKQDTIIEKQTKVIGTLNTAIVEKDIAYSTLWVSHTRLEDIIKNTPKAPSNPDKLFGFIKKPSRTTTFLTGVAVGILATVTIVK